MSTIKNLAIIAHKYLTQPDDELVAYLGQQKYPNVLHIMHHFSDAKDRRSYYCWYREGRVYKKKQTIDYRFLPEPIVYLKEMVVTFIWILTTGRKWDVYIGMDGLCSLWGHWFRPFLRIKKVIYWVIDFVPQNRFYQKWKNWIYKRINISAYRHADEIWDLSKRMDEAREIYWGVKRRELKQQRIVPYGMWLNRIAVRSYSDCDKNVLLYMGHLTEKQGVQLVLRVMPEILKKRPDIVFKIIGGGTYYPHLVKLTQELNIKTHCQFLGKIESIIKLEEEVAKACVAIAPYLKGLDHWTKYADPGKLKTYLACGVPVLTTDLSWNAREIEEKKCGRVISEDSSDIVEKVDFLMNPDCNQTYRSNARAYAETFDYAVIFGGLFPMEVAR